MTVRTSRTKRIAIAYEDAYLAWDVISGLKHPEYGGSLELIDILGLKQLQLRADGICRRRQAETSRSSPGDDRFLVRSADLI